jgi:hypothetical protein
MSQLRLSFAIFLSIFIEQVGGMNFVLSVNSLDLEVSALLFTLLYYPYSRRITKALQFLLS